jgi:hypothetical protein
VRSSKYYERMVVSSLFFKYFSGLEFLSSFFICILYSKRTYKAVYSFDLFNLTEPVGYGDALIAILPSFPGIKKLQ